MAQSRSQRGKEGIFIRRYCSNHIGTEVCVGSGEEVAPHRVLEPEQGEEGVGINSSEIKVSPPVHPSLPIGCLFPTLYNAAQGMWSGWSEEGVNTGSGSSSGKCVRAQVGTGGHLPEGGGVG